MCSTGVDISSAVILFEIKFSMFPLIADISPKITTGLNVMLDIFMSLYLYDTSTLSPTVKPEIVPVE